MNVTGMQVNMSAHTVKYATLLTIHVTLSHLRSQEITSLVYLIPMIPVLQLNTLDWENFVVNRIHSCSAIRNINIRNNTTFETIFY